MKYVCMKDQCTGCKACINICSKSAISIIDNIISLNAAIDNNKCINCNRCHNVCPQNNTIELFSPRLWIQGWASDKTIRKNSSSGGFATAIAKEFIKSGGIVVACCFINGEFIFDLFEDEYSLRMISGSKYVKSDPKYIFSRIKEKLLSQKVLFIGLPCQVAGLKKYIPVSLQTNLYTIDLICHGTPSNKVLIGFLKHYKLSLNDIKDILFRTKGTTKSYKKLTPIGVVDRYTLGFLKGLDFTESCYDCRYAGINRCSDITLGDSWGSALKKEEQNKGISLALVITEKGMQMINHSKIEKFNVDVDKAIESNRQLQMPYKRTPQRKKFINGLKNEIMIYELVGSCYKKICIKQDMKRALIKLNLLSKQSYDDKYSICIKKNAKKK